MKTHVAAVDCGTSAVKTALFDLQGGIRGLAIRECPCAFHRDGRIEQDPARLSATVFDALRETLRKSRVSPGSVAAIAVANQRATVIAVGGDGEPAGPAISWQDMRGAGEIERFRRVMDDRRYYRETGLPNNPVFSLAKILWIRRHDPRHYRRTARFLLVHDFVARELGVDGFLSDWSNASLTGLMELARFRWSADILGAAGLDPAKLPDLVPPGIPIGAVSRRAAGRSGGLLAGTPIVSGAGDQQCAGLGAGAVEPGRVAITLGTAGVAFAFADRPIRDPRRRIMCCAHAVAGKWNVEGLQNSAGASLQWLCRLLNGGTPFAGSWFRKAERAPPGSRGVRFYPFLAGASAPNWNPEARAVFLGLEQRHDQYDLLRAVMEGVSLETRQILEAFEGLGVSVRRIRLTGGCARIETWNRIQADLQGRPLAASACPEATLLGAGILAACGSGCHSSARQAVRAMVHDARTYAPDPRARRSYDRLYESYVEGYRLMNESGLFRVTAGGVDS